VKRRPVRTCVGCRMRDPKSSLVRIVAALDGARIDPSGDAPGRGAYVHPATACMELARRPGALGSALRTGLAGDEVGRLMLEIERMGAA
jgi:predicted RNA-binding protein YlxR (DUF448 family)